MVVIPRVSSKLIFVSLVSFLLTMFCVLPVDAGQIFPGRNGQIAYTQSGADYSAIWTVDQDGSRRQRLARNAQTPVWSPDGKKIGYVRGGELWIMNADGSGQRDLVRGHGGAIEEGSLVWSADGSRLAFVREVSWGAITKSAVFAVRANGSRLTNISGWSHDVRYRSPSWSPQANVVVYEKVQSTTDAKLLIKNLTNGSTHELTTLSDVTASADVSWSPNGQKIMFRDSVQEIYTIWPDGSHRSVISDGESYDASWSPDGEKIAFLEDHSGESVSISQEDGTVVWIPVNASGYYEDISEPVWSPDGTKLIFTMGRSTQMGYKASLFTLDLESGSLTRLPIGNVSELNWQAK